MEAASLHAPAGLRAPTRSGLLLRVRTDDQLVALFRLGNEEAFRVIHDRYRARLLAYTRQMLPVGSSADAEDALQDVFIRAYAALRADGRPVTLRAWLYRVAHNRCIDHLRRPANQAAAELPEELAALPGATRDPYADVQRRDDLARLVRDIAALPEQQRSALLMREMEGLSYAELGDALGVTVPAVKSLLVRARIGLTEARDARDTACVEIRDELALSHDKGVRATARSRRHLKECSHCSDYRASLKGLRAEIAALGPATGPWAFVLKLLGIGGAGSAGLAGGGSAAGGGVAAAGGTTAASGAVAGGGGLAAVGAGKVAALVCAAVAVGGGAVEASHELSPHVRPAHHATAPAAASAAARPSAEHRPAVRVASAAPRTTARAAATGTASATPSGAAATAASTSGAARRQTSAEHRRAELRQGPQPFSNDQGGEDTASDPEAQQADQTGGALAPDQTPPPTAGTTTSTTTAPPPTLLGIPLGPSGGSTTTSTSPSPPPSGSTGSSGAAG